MILRSGSAHGFAILQMTLNTRKSICMSEPKENKRFLAWRICKAMDMTGAKGGVNDVAQANIDAPLHHNLR